MKKTLIVVGVVTIMAALALMFDSSPKKIVCDRFDVRSELKDNVLKFRIDSDLPDDAIVSVSVSRSYIEKGDSAEYSIAHYYNKTTMFNFKKEQIIQLNNDRWKHWLRKKQVKMSRLGYGFDVASVSDKVELRAVVPTRQANPDFGENNVNLRGKAVTHKGIRIVEDNVSFEFPMKDPPVGKSPVPNLNPRALDVGAIYTIEKQTPLMPHYNPKNPALAIRQMKYLPWESQIKILKKKNLNGRIWYRVSATSRNGIQLGSGWINSTALLGQKLDGKYK